MKLHRFIFVGLAAWAGMMAYRANLLVSPFMPAGHQQSAPSGSRSYSDGSSYGAGGLGAVGTGKSLLSGNDHGYTTYVSRPAQPAEITLELLNAATDGNLKKLQQMIDEHVLLNARDDNKRTALIYAAWNGRTEACTMLLAAGGNPLLVDKNGHSALDYAAGRGHVETVTTLLQGAGKGDSDNHLEYARLMHAAYAGDARQLPDAARFASINRISPEDQTPLMVAAGNGSVNILQVMADRGANVNLANSEKQTALHWAAWNNQRRSVEWLLAHGAQKNVADKNGDTPLNMAQEKKLAEIAALLK